MSNLFIIDGYFVRGLKVERDTQALQNLCEACSDYYKLCEGHDVLPNAGEKLFYDAPEGKSLDEKMTLGIYSTNEDYHELVGVIDMLKDYPEQNAWFVGLFMIKPSERSNKLGEKIFREYVPWVEKNKVEKITIGVLEENERAFKFWRRIGFEVVKRIDNYEIGNKTTTVNVMEYEI